MPTKKASPKATSVAGASKKVSKRATSAKSKNKKSTAKKSTTAKKVAKTSSKKAATKKSTVKKAAAKKSATKGKALVCASGSSCFWTNDGQVLEDLLTLRDALDIMSDDVFSHHVTKEKNDFADWVESVLLDYECAAALRKSKKPNTARTVVVRHLRYYNV